MLRFVKTDSPLGDLNREVYSDEALDLVVWYDNETKIHGFQLTYDVISNPHAMTWLKEKGLFHNRVDMDEGKPGRRGIPILELDGEIPVTAIIGAFDARSTGLERSIRDCVRKQLGNLKG
jgi:hypothetical protein